MTALEPRLFTKEQAAQYCGLSISGFGQWVACGKVPEAIEVLGTVRWDKKAIDIALGNSMEKWVHCWSFDEPPSQAAIEIETFLYRLFNKDEELLYIGISYDVRKRLDQHATDKEWFHEVHTAVVETYPSRPKALSAEREAIWDEDPLHNCTYKKR